MQVEPVVLDGVAVRLEPLSMGHLPHLLAVGCDPELWRWTVNLVRTPAEMEEYLQSALAAQAAGSALPFATVHKPSGRVVGSTRFGNIDPAHRRVEIGWTWVGRPWQRTVVNTEAKYLMLRHAFEVWDCVRVEFKTDALNERSRAALLGIGATFEGTFRKHMIMADGRERASAYYSVIDAEWPLVRERLASRVRQRAADVPSSAGRATPPVPSAGAVDQHQRTEGTS